MQLKTRNKSATEPTYFDYFYIYDFVCLYLDFTFRIDIRECIPVKIYVRNKIFSFGSSSHFMLISSRYDIHVAGEYSYGIGPIEIAVTSLLWSVPTYAS